MVAASSIHTYIYREIWFNAEYGIVPLFAAPLAGLYASLRLILNVVYDSEDQEGSIDTAQEPL